MISGIDQLGEVEQLASNMLARMSPGQRSRILRAMVGDLGRANRGRIAAQRDPDGTPFAPRKARADDRRASPLVFLYPAGAAEPKLVVLSDWTRRGDLVTGYDRESRAEKSYTWARIDRFLPPERAAGAGGGRLRRKGAVRRRAMFRKLRTAAYLKTGASADEAWVGFTGRASAIARKHHDGGEDERPGGRIRYPRRQLLGVTEADRQTMLNRLFAAIAGDGA